METLLQVKGLKKYFPVTKGFFKRTIGYVRAVDDVSFDIGYSETFGLVGESGCGKTTVGKLILRLREATEGEILFEGTDFRRLQREELRFYRRNMQIIFQDPYGSLNPRMSIGEIIQEPMIKHKTVGRRKELDKRLVELLDVVGLNKRDAYKYPHEFSGGQRQRIVVARALSVNPKLIVCDEPVSALDVSVQAQILNLLSDLQKQFGLSYLFIAHGMPVVKHISNRVGVMYLGKLVEIADKNTIFEGCLHPYTKALMSAVPIPWPGLERHQIILQGEVPNPMNPPKGCKFHTRCPKAQDQCVGEDPVLKEAHPGHWVSCHFCDKM
jgi:oligopeptide/dipeptide ABC transporter ATP-binding protein